jgi:hypothetical protein
MNHGSAGNAGRPPLTGGANVGGLKRSVQAGVEGKLRAQTTAMIPSS